MDDVMAASNVIVLCFAVLLAISKHAWRNFQLGHCGGRAAHHNQQVNNDSALQVARLAEDTQLAEHLYNKPDVT